MADVDFPAWGWAWIAAGVVAVPLLVIVLLRDLPRRGAAASPAASARFHGRAMLWWGLGVMTFVLAEVFESDPLTWAALFAFGVGYGVLAARRAWGPEGRRAAGWAALSAAVVLGYSARLAQRAGHFIGMTLLALAAAALVAAATRLFLQQRHT